jgi:hypothetical protein
MKNLLPIYYLNGGIYYRFVHLPIIYRFALAENERANRSPRKTETLDWQPIVKVEDHRLKQDSVKHPVELKEESPSYDPKTKE